MASEDDWRLTGQEQYLFGVSLSWKAWKRPVSNPGWDHDHCDFCWKKFSDIDHPEIVHEGYATTDSKHWICRECYNDFRETFRWQIE
jgi:hypothetical protein